MSIKLKLMTTVAALTLAAPLAAQTAEENVDCSQAENATLTVCMEAATDGEVEDSILESETDMADDETGTDPMMESENEMASETENETMMETDTDMADTDTATGSDDTMMTADGTSDDAMSPMADGVAEFEGMTVAEILGMNVIGANGETVGEIDYIYQTGSDYDAVIGIGGFLGLGEHTVALPLSAFAVSPEDETTLVLDGFTEEELEAMQEIDETGLESLPDDHVIS